MVKTIEPMLAETLDPSDIDKLDWASFISEIKLDGCRAVAYVNDGKVELRGRDQNLTPKFPELSFSVRKPCVIDGEITSADMSFEGIQHRVHKTKPMDIRIASKRYPVIYWAFDILNLNGQDLTKKPLIERKEMLWENLIGNCGVRYLAHGQDGVSLFEKVKRLGLEGIMAKRKKSKYQAGKRSDDWLKIKTFEEGTYLIVGVTEGEGDRENTFGSLILAKETENGLAYVGNVGSGFNKELLETLTYVLGLREYPCPFATEPDVGREVRFWTEPVFYCEVKHLGYGSDGLLRFPVFKRLKGAIRSG